MFELQCDNEPRINRAEYQEVRRARTSECPKLHPHVVRSMSGSSIIRLWSAANIPCQRNEFRGGDGEDKERSEVIPEPGKPFVVCVPKCKPQYQELSRTSVLINMGTSQRTCLQHCYTCDREAIAKVNSQIKPRSYSNEITSDDQRSSISFLTFFNSSDPVTYP